jgi:hypothetical protein
VTDEVESAEVRCCVGFDDVRWQLHQIFPRVADGDYRDALMHVTYKETQVSFWHCSISRTRSGSACWVYLQMLHERAQ